jgi:hypothetical protein
MENSKVKECGGCKKYDCEDYPYLNDTKTIVVSDLCLLCKHFKKFNLYVGGNKQ